MTDWHVHIGQWFNSYNDAGNVFAQLKTEGIDEVWFSSTTSKCYCTESLAVQENEKLRKTLPTPFELYELIRYEIQETLSAADKIGIKAHPLYWVVPEIHFSGVATVADAMESLPYEGFKIHPRGNPWNLNDSKTVALAEEVFFYAETHRLLTLIHCGTDEFELPTKFELYIAASPHATIQIAHSRPLKETLYMLRKYPNTVCDSAFVPPQVQEAIRTAGFANRMRYGSDYPITPTT